ncbi:MAG: hypothetical protein M3421_12005, partial [Bacteroidota bacterium]|nr:hypothetical protein [Bacteroidota bacterium]
DYYPYGLVASNWVRQGEKATKDLFQGKTYEELTQWSDFHARQYDAAVGRWFGVDPQNQFSSPYTGMGNNPVMMVDPDGELAFLAVVGIAAAIGGISNWAAHGAKFSGEGLRHFGIGAAIGAAAGATGGALSGALGGSYGAMIAGGAASGAISGGLNAGVYGGNIGAGIWQGALGGAIGGMVPSVGVNGIVPGAIVGAAGGALGGGLAGGTLSAINGGSFGSGFAQGARNGALGGALSGGVYGGISAANSKYERNIVFGNATKAGKMALLRDLARANDVYNNGVRRILYDARASVNGETIPVIAGAEFNDISRCYRNWEWSSLKHSHEFKTLFKTNRVHLST